MSRSVAEATAAAGAFLQACRNADAGWGYAPGGASLTEPSAVALLALDALGRDGTDAAGWLLSCQNPDGGWGIAADDDESGWHTSWTMLALASRPRAAAARERAVAWLQGHQGLQARTADDPDKREPILQIDLSLRAWPWLHDQAPWVEPTSLALLALSRCGAADGSPLVDEAVQYLVDRRCHGGGWNFGNPYMFVPLPARAPSTSFAVMALDACSPGDVTAEDLQVLRAENERDGGALAAALTVLCLRCRGEAASGESTALLALQGGDGGWDGSCYCTALAVLALTGAVL